MIRHNLGHSNNERHIKTAPLVCKWSYTRAAMRCLKVFYPTKKLFHIKTILSNHNSLELSLSHPHRAKNDFFSFLKKWVTADMIAIYWPKWRNEKVLRCACIGIAKEEWSGGTVDCYLPLMLFNSRQVRLGEFLLHKMIISFMGI